MSPLMAPGDNRLMAKALLLLLILAACQLTEPVPPPPSVAPATRSSAPASCDADSVRIVVTAFIDAFNRGEDPARYFAPGGLAPASDVNLATRFRWYSASGFGVPHVAIYDRHDLAPYFARRHAIGERWSLVTLTPLGVQDPRADFVFTISRSAPDLRPGEPQHGGPPGTVFGKGALNCEQRTILVFTM